MLIEILTVAGLILANVVCYACHDKSLLRGRLKGPRLLFVSNRSGQSSKVPKGYWALDLLDPSHLVTSYILNDVCLLLLRATSFVFFAITLMLEGLTGDGFGNPLGWFTFYTNWTFILFGVWSFLGVILTGWAVQAKLNTNASKASSPNRTDEEAQSLTGVAANSEEHSSNLPKLRMKWGPLSVAFLFVSETVATSTLFLSFFYWTFLFSPKYPIEVDNLLKHGVNNIVILLDFFFSRTPVISYHYQVCLLYGTVYTLFMWIYHAASLHWVYYVLDWSQPAALALYMLNPLFLFAAFVVWYLVACAREWLGQKLNPSQRAPSLQQVDFQ